MNIFISFLVFVVIFYGFATILLLSGEVPGSCDSPPTPEKTEYVVTLVLSFFAFTWLCIFGFVKGFSK